MVSTVGGLVETTHLKPVRDICNDNIRFYDMGLPIMFLERYLTELRIAGLTILHEMTGTLLAGRGMQTSAGKRYDYQGMNFVECINFAVEISGRGGVEG